MPRHLSKQGKKMPHLDIRQFICLEDNYGVVIHDSKTGATAAIDAPDAAKINEHLRKFGRQLTHIFVTHHHVDHVQGILELKQAYGCKVIGPAAEAQKIPGLDVAVSGGQSFDFAGRSVNVYDCPGHTLGHIAYYIPSESAVFVADTIFSVGCGRVNEGTFGQMFRSINQFSTLPPSTFIYCGHEYTEANCRFALTIEPGNRDLQARANEVSALRKRGEMTCPVTLANELKTNPYLRCDSPEIRKVLGMEQATDIEVFTEIRTRKNNFK
jgi:hydroxyacylglutathione hydrolase